MPEVGTFLRAAWAAAERTRVEKEAAADSARIAEEVNALQESIATANREIANSWGRAGKSLAAEAGICIIYFIFEAIANERGGNMLLRVLAVPGVLAFGLAMYIGAVVVAVSVFGALATNVLTQAKIASLEADIKSRRKGRR